MGWAPLPGFIGDSYQSRSVNADAQRCLNMYMEVLESSQAKNRFVLYGTPGSHVFGTLPTSPVRGLWAGDGRLFAIGGNILYEVSNTGAILSTRGTLGGGSTPVRLYANGTVLFGVDAGYAFYDNGTTIVQVKDNLGDAIDAAMGAYSDGYFIAQIADSNQVNISPPLDNTAVWDPLQFFSKTGAPDRLLATINDHEELYLFGYETAELWRDTGNGLNGFAYQKDPGGTMILGISAPWTATSLDAGVAWIVEDVRGRGVAQLAQGYQPSRISTHAVEEAWAQYSTVGDAEAYAYRDEGHQFWVINFPSGPATWVYDVTVSQALGRPIWHERTAAGATSGMQLARCHAFAFQKHLVGSWTSGVIYQQSNDFFDEAGAAITRIRTCPHLSNLRIRTFGHTVVLEADTGGASIHPTLAWSNDANRTYSTEHVGVASTSTLGANQEIKYNLLGYWRDRIWRLTLNDKVKIALINAYLLSTDGID